MGFIRNVIIIYLTWQVIKWVVKWALRYWVVKNGGKAFYQSSGFGQANSAKPSAEGEIRVDSFAKKSTGNPGDASSKLGEYVDFEEVK